MCVLDIKQWSELDLDVLRVSYHHMLTVIYREAVPDNAVPHGQVARCIAKHPQVFSRSGKDTKCELLIKLHFTTNRCYTA